MTVFDDIKAGLREAIQIEKQKENNIMREPNRIEPFLNELSRVWKANPDYRFTQLIVNVMQACGSDMYYVQDDKFLEILKEYYGSNT